jgi:hypothetical protein
MLSLPADTNVVDSDRQRLEVAPDRVARVGWLGRCGREIFIRCVGGKRPPAIPPVKLSRS